MASQSWQLQVFKRSLKKREKRVLIEKELVISTDSVNLDLGCAQGTLSYFLRKKGGMWLSADQDFLNLKSTQNLLGENLIQLTEGSFPFKNNSFDSVVSLDYLEHLDEDDFCLQEIHRILKKKGQLVLATPQTGNLFWLHKLRSLLGLKLEFYGHKREGYSLHELRAKLEKAGFVLQKHRNFSRFITEFLELILNFVYVKFFGGNASYALRDGHIRPTTSEEFSTKKTTFRLYSALYPLVWLISRLDKALFFLKGYGLMIWAKRMD
ncbi:MAG: methyltransferase domain-containing protein [Candidatus Aminicenantes bacterium]|nr:MAG: methyltransferase domain-containing protein [Candidatus Aminicenantes bacterium]